MHQVLKGLRVIDFSGGAAGALAAMMLSDFGADTIRIVRPGTGAGPDPAALILHRGKRAIEADLKVPAGLAATRELLDGADVSVMDWRPGVAGRLGLSYEQCQQACPALVYCSITGFGPRGPDANLKGYDAVVAARAGLLRGPEPVLSAVPDATFGAAQGALQGILAALYARAGTGRGQRVEASLAQGLSAYDLYGWFDEQLAGRGVPAGSATTYAAVTGMQAWTSDGHWLQLANFRPHQLRSFLAAADLDGDYERAVAAGKSGQELQDLVRRRLSERTLAEWQDRFARFDDTAVEPLRFGAESMAHPQLVHNGDIIEVAHPVAGATRQLGPLVRSHARLPLAPAPRRPAGGSGAAAVPGPGQRGAPPLAGVTAVELAWFYAAPFGLALLADLGARVIKVENLDGDPHRYQGRVPEAAGIKGLQGKESLAVDVNTPQGQEILGRLVAKAQLVMRNFRQSSSERMGIDYEHLSRHNPELVYLYAGAYGSSGPYASRPAYAPTIAAAAGYPAYGLGWPAPMSQGSPLGLEEGRRWAAAMQAGGGGVSGNADAAAALGVGTAAVLGVLAGRLGWGGLHLETSMLCTAAYALAEHFVEYPGRPPRRVPDPDQRGIGPLYRLYRASDGWLLLACPQEREWPALAAALGEASGGTLDLAGDGRFATAASRAAHSAALAGVLAAAFAQRPAKEWEVVMAGYDIACAEASQQPLGRYTIESPGALENGFVAQVENPIFGPHLRHGPLATLSANPAVAGPSPRVGAHTRSILAELGYSRAEVRRLRAGGIVAWPEGPEAAEAP